VNLPPTDDIVIVVVGALVAGFVNGLSGTGYALAALGFWLHAMSPIGTVLLDRVQVQPLKFGVGLLLIFYVSWMAFMRRPPVVHGGGKAADAAVAFVGGVMGGMASLSGPAPTIWAQLRGWNKHEQRAVNQPFNMSVLALAFVSAGVAGFLDRTFFLWAAIAVPCTLLGARIGLMLYGRINDVQFRRIVLILLGLSGVTLIVSAL
jgi:uncharacterized membrane protein YfcA